MNSVQNPAARGWFITLEGIDGAGKSTQMAAIAQALREHSMRICVTREPGGTPLGEQLREMLLHQPMQAQTELLLAFAARREHLAQVIVPALGRGECVVCDRFTDASYAYQGAGRGIGGDLIAQLEVAVQSGWNLPPAPGGPGAASALLQPDCTFLLELPVAVAAGRLHGTRLPDRFEAQDSDFFERVAAGYRERAERDPRRFVRISTETDKADIKAQIHRALLERGIIGPDRG